ncbi:hypothetical protein [Candidatus Enterovibrio altilux]|uniref:Uncharacterized protein n=1 Tax=Candidatus Enterovibrio altilux TaxID=1927128 RepID=A0A291BAC4_9GAMM|nr:hypothetical protein [Candidatus Enterovibrio luxaltus]ATF09931.1 hypothetical protein BTN50_1455 [Candidatus Enterovibrio luxaltus]
MLLVGAVNPADMFAEAIIELIAPVGSFCFAGEESVSAAVVSSLGSCKGAWEPAHSPM